MIVKSSANEQRKFPIKYKISHPWKVSKLVSSESVSFHSCYENQKKLTISQK